MQGDLFERRKISRLSEVDVHTETKWEDSLGQGRILVPEMPWFLQARCREMRKQSTLSWLDDAEEQKEILIDEDRLTIKKTENMARGPEATILIAICKNCGKTVTYERTDFRKFIYHACDGKPSLFAMENPNLQNNENRGKYSRKTKWKNFDGD